MILSIKFQGGLLWVTVSGKVSVADVANMYTMVCQVALQNGMERILIDASKADGHLSLMDRYQLGRAVAEYSTTKPMTLRIATVGKAPLVDGFGAVVASNRNVSAAAFSDATNAVKWLNRFARSLSSSASGT
jgi:hypothetical protein